MTQHEITFRRAVAIITAAVSAGQLSIQNSSEIKETISLIYSALIDAEATILDDSLFAYAMARQGL